MVGALVAVGLLGAVPVAVFAAQPACGDTLTSNTTLTANLDCSGYSGDALTMGANRVVLNLNGHTITGNTGDDSYDGVETNGYNKTVIKNGTIANFGYGVDIEESNQTLVKNLTIVGDGSDPYGIYAYQGVGNMIRNVHMTNVYYGLYATDGANLSLLNSTIDTTYDAVYTEYESQDLFQNNVITSSGADYGFYDDYGGSNRYIGNSVTGTSSYAFYLDCDSYGKVILTDNVASDNDGYGFYVYECYGDTTTWAPGSGSMISGNRAINNGDYGFYDYYSVNATWMYNVSNRNGEYGFYFDYPGGDIIKYNKANHNGSSGFDIEDNYGAGYYNVQVFSRNSANWNDGYGFYAGYGAPGKYNTARHNADANCYDVACG
jgi:hypothetical protein